MKKSYFPFLLIVLFIAGVFAQSNDSGQRNLAMIFGLVAAIELGRNFGTKR